MHLCLLDHVQRQHGHACLAANLRRASWHREDVPDPTSHRSHGAPWDECTCLVAAMWSSAWQDSVSCRGRIALSRGGPPGMRGLSCLPCRSLSGTSHPFWRRAPIALCMACSQGAQSTALYLHPRTPACQTRAKCHSMPSCQSRRCAALLSNSAEIEPLRDQTRSRSPDHQES